MSEAEAVALLAQGALTGSVLRPEFPLRVVDVDLPMNRGQYLNYFVVTLQSGIKIRVTVEPEESSG